MDGKYVIQRWKARAAEVIAVAVIGVCAVRETDDTMRDR